MYLAAFLFCENYVPPLNFTASETYQFASGVRRIHSKGIKGSTDTQRFDSLTLNGSVRSLLPSVQLWQPRRGKDVPIFGRRSKYR